MLGVIERHSPTIAGRIGALPRTIGQNGQAQNCAGFPIPYWQSVVFRHCQYYEGRLGPQWSLHIIPKRGSTAFDPVLATKN